MAQSSPPRDAGHQRAQDPHRGGILGPRVLSRSVDAPWVDVVRRVALAVFIGLLVVCAFAPARAGRLFWTVSVAALPLLFVLAGYHRWRRICPLAAFAEWPSRIGHGGHRRAGDWLQSHAYHVAFAIFMVCLWLRLVATNGDGHALLVFLLVLCAGAVVTGALYTGKTWCNYFCPVSFVEKLYTEPRGLRDTVNSQCATCTACRPACPDINEENSYWKEVRLPSKRDVYYAFPGVVLAFYAYYYFQSGGWDYYFGGRWTNEPGLVATAFSAGVDARSAGLAAWPSLPRAVASALTLLAGVAASTVAFRTAEPMLARILARRGHESDDAYQRHVMFSAAAFTAFIIFYSFAGAPTLRLVPGLPHAFQLVVVAVATVLLIRRMPRRQSAFAEETLARKIIANWRWQDVAPPRDLREAFLIHTIRSRSLDDARRQLLELYKSAVRDSVMSGIVSRSDVHRLNALRQQLHVSDADHEQVMAELADEQGGLSGTMPGVASPEKQLQLDTYAEALALHLEQRHSTSAPVDDAFVRGLRDRYGVTVDEHAAVIERLLQRGDRLAGHLDGVPAAIESLAAAVEVFAARPSPAARFFVKLLRRRWRRAAETMVRTLAGDGAVGDALRDALCSGSPSTRDEAVGVVGGVVSPATAVRLRAGVEMARRVIGSRPEPERLLREQLASPDPYLRAVAVYLLESMDALRPEDCDSLETDEHEIVRDTAAACRSASCGAALGTAATLEKMIALGSVGIFDDLEPEDLAQLASAGTETWFAQGEHLCREGEPGDEVFVLLDGEVSIEHAAASERTGVEGPGTCIGELAVLDPAPREATVRAATIGVRTLRLTGGAFRHALESSPVVSEAIIRVLARRLRRALPGADAHPSISAGPHAPRSR